MSISRYCIQIQVGSYILYADYRVRLADVIKRWMAIIWEIRPCIVISFSNYSTAGLVYSMYHHYRPYVIGTFIKGPWKINVLTQYSILALLSSQHQYYSCKWKKKWKLYCLPQSNAVNRILPQIKETILKDSISYRKIIILEKLFKSHTVHSHSTGKCLANTVRRTSIFLRKFSMS